MTEEVRRPLRGEREEAGNDDQVHDVPTWGIASFQRLLADHLTLVASTGLAALVTFKVFAFSRYDPETAAAVLQVAGTADVLVGTLLSLLPTLVVLALGQLIVRRWRWFGSLQPVERSVILAAFALPATLVLLMVPVAFAGIYIGTMLAVHFLVLFAARRQASKDAAPRPSERMSPTEAMATRASLPAFLFFLLATTTWLPSESVSVGGTEPVAAYVVGTRGDDTLFLPFGRHKGLVSARTDEVRRIFCSDRGWLDVSVLQLMSGPRYPKCPSD